MYTYTHPEQILNEFHAHTERTLRSAEHIRALRATKPNRRSRPRRHRRPEREWHVGSVVRVTNLLSFLR